MLTQHTRTTLFPYTTLFRSKSRRQFVRSMRLIEGDKVHLIHITIAIIVEVRNIVGLPLHRLESLHEGLAISGVNVAIAVGIRSEEHTSELQSHSDLVCRLLL